MDRFFAMLILLGVLVSLVLMILALFAVAPIVCTCLLSLVYTLYLFMAYEESSFHHAQEYENRFWTIFALLFSTAIFFAKDSPFAFGQYSPSLGFLGVFLSSYAMHLYDRYMHRVALSRQTKLRRSLSLSNGMGAHQATAEELLSKLNVCLRDIDQLLIPSTINNFLNRRFVLKKEKEIITIFVDCDATTLNYLICHVKLALLVYKIKDHGFGGQHRTELIKLIAVERLAALTVMSRVIVIHALQVLKLRANPRAEHWVRNIFLSTHGDDLSEVKTLTDAKGDYYGMSKLIYDDIKSETVRQDILTHIRKEGAMQVSRRQLGFPSRGPRRRQVMAWKKILSDVDDTLLSSGGLYPAGIDKRYPRKVVYPGVLAFYRELDLGTTGPEDWPDQRVGNLVFLSARPHVYKDMSEKSNFAKFEKLRVTGADGRRGMHTTPSLLAGDLASGSQYIATNDFQPLAVKKFDNFKRYVSIYPEYSHIFVCDNGQGDVHAGEMMHDNFPYEFQSMYVHVVQAIPRTYGYAPERWREKEFFPCFFTTYPEAALHAATQDPPLIRITGLQRVCADAVRDFDAIPSKKWQSSKQKADRRAELNQAIWRANQFLLANDVHTVDLVQAERLWKDGEKVKTPYGNGVVRDFNPEFDLYTVDLDWRPLDVQVNEHLLNVKEEAIRPKPPVIEKRTSMPLETVVESDEVTEDDQGVQVMTPTRSRLRPQQTLVVSVMSPNRRKEPSADEEARVNNAVIPLVSQSNDSKSKPSNRDIKNATSAASDSSTISSVSSDESNTEEKPDQTKMKVTATVSGRSLSKFIPPSLPAVNKKPSPLFSFWVPGPKFVSGDKCTTPYGPATVLEHRVEEKIIVAEMIGWSARAYLNEADVKVIKEGLLASFFRRQQSITEPVPKYQHFPYVKGTIIRTPFGDAEIVVPIPTPDEDPTNQLRDHSNDIITLNLTSWMLANGSHPKLHATVKNCRQWKEIKGNKASTDGLFSAFGRFVSSIDREIKGRLGSQKPKDEGAAAVPKFKQYYQISAAVATDFGNGRVVSFRDIDGFYCVSLSSWPLANGQHPVAWLRGLDIRIQVAKGCKEGYPVLTNLGVTGIFESVQATTGIHIVTAHPLRMVLYLQPDAIVRPLKAAVGEVVQTAFGEGTVQRYDIGNETYEIRANWGATIFSKAETFDRLRDSIRDKDGYFGIDWLLRFFFDPSKSNGKEETRSRSNSLVSGSVRSQSGSRT
ncbi:TRAPP trafficking subunit Trs65-domain containing protein [Nitzschia inconspicua]|uniref:TRAPP trafficking subunit Trs65-domain containing protein n=1 Tax=Nitzschia inconspicua TaxID=303405 RepID=A0A9K3LGF8_9STRA|nr:TRAPP trafficking subunit Trs65-domain containing protein [Nitzschia inconspicua]